MHLDRLRKKYSLGSYVLNCERKNTGFLNSLVIYTHSYIKLSLIVANESFVASHEPPAMNLNHLKRSCQTSQFYLLVFKLCFTMKTHRKTHFKSGKVLSTCECDKKKRPVRISRTQNEPFSWYTRVRPSMRLFTVL